jgi:hypothetical protein
MAYKIPKGKAETGFGKPIWSKEDYEAYKLKKDYNVMYNIGKAKYLVNYYSGKKYKDGSKFYDIKILRNKKELAEFEKELKEKGFRKE